VQKSGGDYKKLAQKRAQLLKDLEIEEVMQFLPRVVASSTPGVGAKLR